MTEETIQVAALTGNPADDAQAIGAGTGVKIPAGSGSVTKAAVIATGLAYSDIGADAAGLAAAAATASIPVAQKGAASGVGTLDSGGKQPSGQVAAAVGIVSSATPTIINSNLLSERTIGAPSGTSDDSVNIAAMCAGNGRLLLGPGLFKHSAQSILLPGNTGGLVIQGSGIGSTILQSQNGTCAAIFRAAITANDQEFADITFQDLTIDANNIVATGGALLYAVNGAFLRTSFNRIRFRRCRIINLSNSSSSIREGVYIRSTTGVGDAFTKPLATMNDLLFEDYECLGGMYGANIWACDTAAGQANINVKIDRFHAKGIFHHDTLGYGLAGGNGAHLDIGGGARCGSVTIDHLIGAGSPDVGLEVDNCADLHVGTVDVTDWSSSAV
jgi:hypothetical protein